MPDVVVAIDEATANLVVKKALDALPAGQTQGQHSFGYVRLTWNAVMTIGVNEGVVDLLPSPNDIRLGKFRVDYELSGSVYVDLSFLDFCIEPVCIDLWFITLCTPEICVHFPTFSAPFTHSSSVTFAVDLHPTVSLVGGVWYVQADVVGTPSLSVGAAANSLIVVLGAIVTPILLGIPILGPFLSTAVPAVLAYFTIANVGGFLGAVVTPFINDITLDLYAQPQRFTVLPATSVDPPSVVSIDSVAIDIQHNGNEDELVLAFDISPL